MYAYFGRLAVSQNAFEGKKSQQIKMLYNLSSSSFCQHCFFLYLCFTGYMQNLLHDWYAYKDTSFLRVLFEEKPEMLKQYFIASLQLFFFF